MTTPALEVVALEAAYERGLPIVRGASLAVQPGEIVAILGPNGAGKSTLVKAVAGLVPITAGRVLLHGADITRVPAHRLVFEGLAFVPQTENVFANLSIAENLELAAAILKANRRERLDPVYAMFPDLERQRTLLAGRLSGGQRQMLAVAREKGCYRRLLQADLTAALPPMGPYAGMTSAGTFTHGHLGPDVLAPLLAVMAPWAVLAFTVHENVWQELDFDGFLSELPLAELQKKKVAIYGPEAAGEAHAGDQAFVVTARHTP